MESIPNKNKNRFIMAMFAMLAAPTNHSLGDVVYKKVSTLSVDPKEDEGRPITVPNTQQTDGESFQIVKLQASSTGLLALIDGGLDRGMLPGTILTAHRPILSTKGSREFIPVAQLKTVQVRETYTIAEVVTNGSMDSQLHFVDYPELMIGDRAEVETIQIASRTQLLPTLALPYSKLFVDPKSNPNSFELTAEGRQILLGRAQTFVDVRASLLLVEGYTDGRGDRSTNQLESYQRALAIRQTLIDELGIDPDRIVAIGMGEAEDSQHANLPGGDDESRRVIIKVKSLPQGN